MRFISLFLRKLKENKNNKRDIIRFKLWQSQMDNVLPDINLKNKSIAIIRIDDIGDYLLFRNTLSYYKLAEKFRGYSITLIGNIVWKEIFERFDSKNIDECIWVDKSKYFSDADYRLKLWQNLRAKAIEITICASRTRPLLIDDILTISIDSIVRIGNANSHSNKELNRISDSFYTQLYSDLRSDHEYTFNNKFMNWATGLNVSLALPFLFNNEENNNSVICFIGASAKSKKWPVEYWIKLIRLLINSNQNPILMGGKTDVKYADKIISKTKCNSIVGKTTLNETIDEMSTSQLIISGDTMAIHLGVSLNKKVIILSNGTNASRFTDYSKLDYKNAMAIYSKAYRKYLGNLIEDTFYNKGTSIDMKGIKPWEVLQEFRKMMQN